VGNERLLELASGGACDFLVFLVGVEVAVLLVECRREGVLLPLGLLAVRVRLLTF
jgi:hypothetical protein